MGSGATTPAAVNISGALLELVRGFQQHGESVELLPLIRQAFKALQLKSMDRSYRREWTANYIMLLGNSRGYRPEILEAAFVQGADFWVNGTLHHISTVTLQKGRRLKRCFAQICELLSSGAAEGDVGVLVCSRLHRALSIFETAWVEFEDWYIKDLIRIEAFARIPLQRAVEMELVLSHFEHHKQSKESKESKESIPTEHSGHLYLPVPRRMSDASGTPSSHATQLSLPRHPRTHPATASQSSPSNIHSVDSSPAAASGYSEHGECPRSRQQTLSGEVPSIAMASQAMASDRAEKLIRKKCELKHLAESAAAARGSTRRTVLEELLSRVGDLNSVANARGKGRKDMTIDVLEAAAQVFLEDSLSSPLQRARIALARVVLEGFLGVRHYLSAVAEKLLWIDPNLSNNADLEQVLVAWEDAWELGVAFLLKKDLFHAMCGVAVTAARACELESTFVDMIEDQDAELFLILPRLVLLTGLQDPSNMSLSRSLLPKASATAGTEAPESLERRLQNCLSELHAVMGHESSFWDALTVHVIRGPGNCMGGDSQSQLEAFLRELEALSMQLQRGEPGKWNRCSGALLRCISAARSPW